MTFDPSLFATVARALVEQPFDKEARTRTALGRAYYALFLAVRQAIRESEGNDIDSHLDHGRLTDVLFSSGDTSLKSLGKVLQELYDARRQADYTLAPLSRWAKKLSKPSYAEEKAKTCEAALRRLPGIDFRSVHGRL